MSRARELAQDARGAVRSAAQTANNAYVDEMVRRADEWIADLERLADDAERYREELSSILTICEDANLAWARLDIAAIARAALEDAA